MLQFALDAYLLPLFYVPPQAELHGTIQFILTSATNSVLGGFVTSTTLLGSYVAQAGASATPSLGTIAPLPSDFLWGVSSSGYQSEGNQGMKIDSNCTSLPALAAPRLLITSTDSSTSRRPQRDQ